MKSVEERIVDLIQKVEEKQSKINKYIVMGTHTPKELLSLKTQEAGFTYMVSELQKILDNR